METKTETTKETHETKETNEKHEPKDHDGADIGHLLLTLAGLSLMEKVGAGELHIIVIGSAEGNEDDEAERPEEKSGENREGEAKVEENVA